MTPFYEHTLAQRFQSAAAAKEMPTQREVLLLLLQLSMGLDHLRKNRVVARNMTVSNGFAPRAALWVWLTHGTGGHGLATVGQHCTRRCWMHSVP